ncbi:MAG: GTP cyclohydrolase I [Bacteroidota bacterium]
MQLQEKIQVELEGDNHVMTSIETPMRPDAFDKSDDEKIEIIQDCFAVIMETLGLDLTDDSLKGTPYRVAKMYVKEIFSGLDPKNKPNVSVFENKYDYNKMLIEKNITLRSSCEHHFLPISGVAHVGYISSGKVIGLSKINRIVDYFGRRPQVQKEELLPFIKRKIAERSDYYQQAPVRYKITDSLQDTASDLLHNLEQITGH